MKRLSTGGVLFYFSNREFSVHPRVRLKYFISATGIVKIAADPCDRTLPG